MHTILEIMSRWTTGCIRKYVIWSFLVVVFAIAIQSQANPENKIWLHDAKVCIAANPNWIILSHHPFGSTSRLDLQLVGDLDPEEVCIYTKLIIKTYDLPNERNISKFSRDILSKPEEETTVTNFQGWIIMSWSEDRGGISYKNIEARTINRNGSSGIGIISHLEWRPLTNRSKDYDQRMSALQKSVISQIRYKSKGSSKESRNLVIDENLTTNPPPPGAEGGGGSESAEP